MDRSWRVVYRGAVTDDDIARLPSDRMLYVSGHQSGNQPRSATFWVRAPDPAAAQTAVLEALPGPGTVSGTTPLPYGVSIGVPERDVETFERVLSERRRSTGEIGPLITTEPTDGFAELFLDVDAESVQEAITRGCQAYSDLRSTAGLASADPPYVKPHPPWPHHQALQQHAAYLRERGDPDLAVVVAQTAFEVLVEQVINERLEEHELGALRSHITSGIRTYALNDDRGKSLWKELMGDAITQSSRWEQYRTHLELRNAVVHQGAAVTDAEASTSLRVVQAMIEHVEALLVR